MIRRGRNPVCGAYDFVRPLRDGLHSRQARFEQRGRSDAQRPGRVLVQEPVPARDREGHRRHAVQRRHGHRVRLPGDRRDLACVAPPGPADLAHPRAVRRRHDRRVGDRRATCLPEEQDRIVAVAARRSHVRDRAPGAGRHGELHPGLSRRGVTARQVLPRFRHLPARPGSSRPRPTTSCRAATPTSTRRSPSASAK